MDFKLKIAQRQQSNVEILQIIGETVMKHPDLRFGQILAMVDIIQYKTVNKIGGIGSICDGTCRPILRGTCRNTSAS